MSEDIKRLYRSRGEHMIAGVCGGLAEYLHTDPTLIRLRVSSLRPVLLTAGLPGFLQNIPPVLQGGRVARLFSCQPSVSVDGLFVSRGLRQRRD